MILLLDHLYLLHCESLERKVLIQCKLRLDSADTLHSALRCHLAPSDCSRYAKCKSKAVVDFMGAKDSFHTFVFRCCGKMTLMKHTSIH